MKTTSTLASFSLLGGYDELESGDGGTSSLGTGTNAKKSIAKPYSHFPWQWSAAVT